MEYSLQTLNEKSNLKLLKTLDLIEKLNLIGFEIDDVSNESFITNRFLDNLKLLIKIPANREDLLNEKFLLNELSTIFLFDLNKLWQKLQKRYYFLLKQKYLEYYQYQTIKIESNLAHILSLHVEVTLAPEFYSPLWIQNKLKNGGSSFTNTVDDLISLNDLEWGQTINCFPLKMMEKNKTNLHLMSLTKVEKFITAEGATYQLQPQTIVLRDESGDIKTVLGLFNKTNSYIRTEENKVLLQSTFYDIYENNLLINPLQTKLSLRYLRKICLENFKFSFQRLLTLFELTSGGKIETQIYTNTPSKLELKQEKVLRLRKILLKKVLNIDVPDLYTFKEAGLKVICQTPDELYFSIPIYRNDLEREIDLVEEYSRFIGYKNFTPIYPTKTKKYLRRKSQRNEFIKYFFINYGFQEVFTNPLQDLKKAKKTSIFIKNPLNNEFAILRETLLERLITIFESNLRLGSSSKDFFEIGRVFENKNNQFKEIDHLGAIFQLRKSKKGQNTTFEWFSAKGFLENFLMQFGYQNFSFEQVELLPSLFHPTKSVSINANGVYIGTFGEINPAIENFNNLKFATYLLEIDLENFIYELPTTSIPIYQEAVKFPLMMKDLSFSLSKETNFLELQKLIKTAFPLLKRVEFFDIYFDEEHMDTIKVGLRLAFQSASETLTNEEIENQISQIKACLVKEFQVNFG
jgi:phenylalanyl-tRNA synthetase beta chain